MSNLRGYQRITTFAKLVGGPGQMVGVLVIGGYVTLRTVEGVIKKVIVKAREKKNNPDVNMDKSSVYTAIREVTNEQGLTIKEGDQVRIMESDEDAILIEVIDREDDPFFVSKDFLHSALGDEIDWESAFAGEELNRNAE